MNMAMMMMGAEYFIEMHVYCYGKARVAHSVAANVYLSSAYKNKRLFSQGVYWWLTLTAVLSRSSYSTSSGSS